MMGRLLVFVQCTDEQIKWGNNDDPRLYMRIGDKVTLDYPKEHSWHTSYYLKEFPGKKFNSVHFDVD